MNRLRVQKIRDSSRPLHKGDQIGLFAVKDGAILDEINNMPFTFNGSSWSGKPILYDDRLAGVTFYAYYPYQPEMTGKTDLIGDDFLLLWQPVGS